MSTRVVSIQFFPAREAKIAAVAVRVRTERLWQHVMAWNLGSGELKAGAWTTKQFRPGLCRLSPCGRFFLYTAHDAGKSWNPATRERPFAGEDGGGTAISRLPWLSALTRIHSRGLYVDPMVGKHTLSLLEEDALFAKFEGTDGHEQFRHQPGWQTVDTKSLPEATMPRRRVADSATETWRAAAVAPERSDVRLIATWRHPRGHSPGKKVWTLVGTALGQPVTSRLNVTCAWMSPETGRLLTAEATGVISLYQPPKIVREGEARRISLRLVARHDLRELTPTPSRPPKKAIEPLSEAELM